MSDPLSALEPALLWERFSELTRIARPPKQEAAARQHVLAWAAARSLESAVDEAMAEGEGEAGEGPGAGGGGTESVDAAGASDL